MPIIIPVYHQTGTKTVALSMNWYRNAHFHQSSKVKRELHELICSQLTDDKFDGPIQIYYAYYYKNPATDLMNFGALASKWLLDALQANGNITKDTVAIVKLETFEVIAQDKLNPRIEVFISPYQGPSHEYSICY